MGSGGSKKPEGEHHNQERRRSHVDTNPPPQSSVLVPCHTCKRQFAADRIKKHSEVCKNFHKKKRDAFDVQGQRLEGTEAEEMRDEINEMEMTRSSGEWKRAHEQMLKDLKKDKTRRRPQSALDNIEIRA